MAANLIASRNTPPRIFNPTILHRAHHRQPVGDKQEFVVGYSDTTVNLHDELVGTRNGKVEVVWSILGRGKLK